jgi:heme oxygenase
MTTDLAQPARPSTAEGFAARLRAGTAEVHAEAEQAAFVRELMGGQGSLTDHAALLRQLRFVYAELEELAPQAAADDPRLVAFLDPRLARCARIDADLVHLLGAEPRLDAAPGAATSAYLVRLREVASTWPTGLLAHHYVRYLGDLSGGQVIGAMLRRHYDAPPEALSFYDFAAVGEVVPYKRRYRELLDTAPFTEDERDALVRESVHAYRLNRFLFDELGAVRASRAAR